MEIIENSYERLVLSHRPWIASALMLVIGLSVAWQVALPGAATDPDARALLLAVAGALLVAWWQFFPFTLTVFDREAGLMVHEERRITGRRRVVVPLPRIAGAEVEAEWSDTARLVRLTLREGRQRVPLERGFGPADRRVLEDAVNEWLTRPRGPA